MDYPNNTLDLNNYVHFVSLVTELFISRVIYNR